MVESLPVVKHSHLRNERDIVELFHLFFQFGIYPIANCPSPYTDTKAPIPAMKCQCQNANIATKPAPKKKLRRPRLIRYSSLCLSIGRCSSGTSTPFSIAISMILMRSL